MPDEAQEALSQISRTLDWLTFYAGWLEGYKAGGGDPTNIPPASAAHEAYAEFVAQRTQTPLTRESQ